MTWTDFEEFICDFLSEWLSSLDAHEIDDFANDFPASYGQFKKLKTQDANYNLSFAGLAYTFKFHLSRADQVATALKFTHEQKNFIPSQKLRILDVGSGTGAGMMGLMLWWTLTQNAALPVDTRIYCTEPSEEMRNIHTTLVPAFQEFLKLKAGVESPTPHILRNDLIECAAYCEKYAHKKVFDLVLFSHTFWIQDRNNWNQTLSAIKHIVKLTKETGVVIFITPNIPSKKRDFVDFAKAQLIAEGMQNIPVDILRTPHPDKFPCPSSFAQQKRPPLLQDMMHKINAMWWEEHSVNPFGEAFGQDPDDYPFYGFFGRRTDKPELSPMVDVLSW